MANVHIHSDANNTFENFPEEYITPIYTCAVSFATETR